MRKLSDEQRAKLKALAEKPDSEIDFSDIPMIEFTDKVTIGKYFRPVKESVTMRIDADVLAWFKSGGEGYQTRINDHLREIMMSSMRKKPSKATSKAKAVKKVRTAGK